MKVETDVVMVLGPFSNAPGGKRVFQREMTKKKNAVTPFKQVCNDCTTGMLKVSKWNFICLHIHFTPKNPNTNNTVNTSKQNKKLNICWFR